MGIFANIVFYILVIITAFSIFTILFSKNTKVYLLSTIVTFMGIAGLYTLLKSPTMFLVQIIFFVIGSACLLLFGTKEFKNENKSSFNFNLKTFFTLLIMVIFMLLTPPFLYQKIKAQVISNFCIEQVFPSTTLLSSLVFILFSILIIAVLSGFYTIAFWRKK